MLIIFSRHGNTFEADQKSYWVGSKEDLVLTSQGEKQAHLFGLSLKESGIQKISIFTGPLKRTLKYAEIVSEYVDKIALKIDEALIELDYGLWNGLTNEEVGARYGSKELDSWVKDGIWPKNAQWLPIEDQVKSASNYFISKLKDQYQCNEGEVIIVISSNGRLRYLLEACTQDDILSKMRDKASVKTGNIGVVRLNKFSAQVLFWNVSPDCETLKAIKG